MKILNKAEIKELADFLCMTEEQAQEVANIFVKIYTEEQSNNDGWKIQKSLENVNDYIKEWEDHWHRESNWQEYFDYEKENCYSDYNNPEKVFENMETFKEEVVFNSYELNSGLIIIVC